MPDQDDSLIETNQIPPDFRSGFVAVVGRPNVGKSTLMNSFLGQKIAIISDKPQTTRNRLLGIYTDDRAQVIFVDTPGIHSPKHKLGETMVQTAMQAIPDADLVLFMVDVSAPPDPEDKMVADAIKERNLDVPVVMAFNKIDLLPEPEILNGEAYLDLLTPSAWLPISAARGDNQEELLDLIVDLLPPGPPYYPADQVTDQHLRFIVAELIREAALNRLHQEVPHALAVMTNEFKQRSQDMTYISATLFVERDTQKGIVIGQGGKTLKDIGRAARKEIEDLLGHRVFLELWVKTRPKWRKKEDELRQMGYGASIP